MIGIEGRIAPRQKLEVTSEGLSREGHRVSPAERMVWAGGMPLGLMKGVRTFTLTPEGGATRFTMREEYTGPMVPLVWRSMPDMQPAFDKLAGGLKARAERAS